MVYLAYQPIQNYKYKKHYLNIFLKFCGQRGTIRHNYIFLAVFYRQNSTKMKKYHI